MNTAIRGLNMETKQMSTENPAYVSFSTFKNVLDLLKEKGGMPATIDASILPTMSGSTRSTLMVSLRFLGLISEHDTPTKELTAIVEAAPDKRKELLRAVLEKKYPHSVKAIANATQISFKKGFEYDVSDAIKSKCINFFIGLAKEAGIAISPHLESQIRVKRPSTRRPQNGKAKAKEASENGREPNTQEETVPEGLKKYPVWIGDRVWFIMIDPNHTKEQIDKFTEMIKLAVS